MVKIINHEIIWSKNTWITIIKNRCKCGGVCDCLVTGWTQGHLRQDNLDKVIGVYCKECGLKIKANLIIK